MLIFESICIGLAFVYGTIIVLAFENCPSRIWIEESSSANLPTSQPYWRDVEVRFNDPSQRQRGWSE